MVREGRKGGSGRAGHLQSRRNDHRLNGRGPDEAHHGRRAQQRAREVQRREGCPRLGQLPAHAPAQRRPPPEQDYTLALTDGGVVVGRDAPAGAPAEPVVVRIDGDRIVIDPPDGLFDLGGA